MHHWLQLAAVITAAIALAVWAYELAFVSRKTLAASRIRYPARSDHRRTKTGGLSRARAGQGVRPVRIFINECPVAPVALRYSLQSLAPHLW
jgi:hypothetical protein